MFKLFPYQRELVDKARQSLGNGNHSVLLVSPAGSGKSVVIAEITRLAIEKGGHVMFMVHRKELVNQITETFTKDGIDLNHTTVMTVGKIKNRLGKLPTPTLIITDETHHSLAKTYRDIYNWYSDVPRLGFTATPWRLSGKGLGDVYDDMVEGPDVQWLIDHNYLAKFAEYGYDGGDKSLLKKSSTGEFTGKSMDDYAKTIIRATSLRRGAKRPMDARRLSTAMQCGLVKKSRRRLTMPASKRLTLTLRHRRESEPESWLILRPVKSQYSATAI